MIRDYCFHNMSIFNASLGHENSILSGWITSPTIILCLIYSEFEREKGNKKKERESRDREIDDDRRQRERER